MSFELEPSVRTTGGVFAQKDLQIYRDVARDLAEGTRIFCEPGNPNSRKFLGRPVREGNVVIVMLGVTPKFWTLARAARKYRDRLEQDQTLVESEKTGRLRDFIINQSDSFKRGEKKK
ncbi:MAG: hypothetical protein A3B38_04340 [Candidatus Levybacteria bacterium RIFCSPLOWO2_01_FULL_36_13]|nr:MAG: hypothetical protein A2684_00085 [Candidatus Levybacteria bacterium RIFCSPHIGHO2_01_FULL_36_15b]OGH34058.1 MAG: hypothetical protein A3B38_04340 [Candidatus Levybacteria bacterium RIFCSPLOWO2_01_FULL_36_13]